MDPPLEVGMSDISPLGFKALFLNRGWEGWVVNSCLVDELLHQKIANSLITLSCDSST